MHEILSLKLFKIKFLKKINKYQLNPDYELVMENKYKLIKKWKYKKYLKKTIIEKKKLKLLW